MKIGILGGAFNPPHIGHLILAQDILEALGLDKIFFIPTNVSPHKEPSEIDPRRRLEMVRLAISDNKNFEALDLEIKRKGVSFTIDTIKELKRIYPDDDFYLIVGSDLARKFSTWKNYEELKKEVKIVVANRKEYLLEGIDSYLMVDIRQINLSSSQIRELVKNKRNIRHLVKEKVADYIQQHNLYKN